MIQNFPEIDAALAQRQYQNGYTPPPEIRVLQIDGKLIGSLQNIVCLSGLPKAGKSLFLTSAIASAFVPYSIFTIATFSPEKRKSVAYFDTESSEGDFYENINRIKKMIGKNDMPESFFAYKFRDLDSGDIMKYIEYFLSQRPEVSLIYIDGLLDLIVDYNDVRESRQIISWLKKITAVYNVLVIGVIHTGKKENNTLGHFGSMIDRYCQSVLRVEKDEKQHTFELRAKFLRSSADFHPVVLQNINGVIEQVN
jgi:hypothetical protein